MLCLKHDGFVMPVTNCHQDLDKLLYHFYSLIANRMLSSRILFHVPRHSAFVAVLFCFNYYIGSIARNVSVLFLLHNRESVPPSTNKSKSVTENDTWFG